MDKNTSISLHLAKVMGLPNPRVSNSPKHGRYVAYFVGDKFNWYWPEFNPFTNRSQWADVVLWFSKARHTLILQSDLVMADYADIHAKPTENTEASIIASALNCIALATGWAG